MTTYQLKFIEKICKKLSKFIRNFNEDQKDRVKIKKLSDCSYLFSHEEILPYMDGFDTIEEIKRVLDLVEKYENISDIQYWNRYFVKYFFQNEKLPEESDFKNDECLDIIDFYFVMMDRFDNFDYNIKLVE
jgi:hypothetical protein